ncbi:MAG TPA: SRPBCC domain-containing protein [Puia sp.]|jgi:uncharacterized protein YndB with AHSA1/START domain|nr:SRPBCC domain-containing protein [Puia sp.]
MNRNWSEFRLRVNIRVPLEKVYPAWATPSGLESWFLSKAIITREGLAGHLAGPRSGGLQKGDQYEWFWHGYPDTISKKGTITSANGTNHLAFTFTMGCPVSISLFREQDETIVELVESGLPNDEEAIYVGDSKGWIFYLTNLKSILEGGLDLRNHNVKLVNVITA